MSTQPIDPRALQAVQEIIIELNGRKGLHINDLPDEFQVEIKDEFVRIIQSHFAESVNGKLLEALKEYLSCCPECGGSGVGRYTNGDPYQCQRCDSGLIAIALAQSQPPSTYSK